MDMNNIQKRVSISLAVSEYLTVHERFNEASRDFQNACDKLRNELGDDERVVVKNDFKHYLVQSFYGDLDIQSIDVI